MTPDRGSLPDPTSGAPVLLDRWSRWEGAIDCGHSGRAWSAAELRELSGRAKDHLAGAGVRPGDPVAFVVANTAAFPVLLMALLELGANPLLTHAAAPPPVVARAAGAFGARHVIHDRVDGVTASAAHDDARWFDAGPVEVGITPTTGEPGTTPIAIPGRGVVLHPTSGTYGAAKYCLRNQAAAVAEATNYLAAVPAYERVRIAAATPLSHAFAYGFGLVSAILSHSTLVLDAAFNPKRVLRREREQPSDIVAIVPPMARALTDLAAGEPSPRMARLVFYAGSPIDPRVSAGFAARFGTPLHAIYGTTETGAIATTHAGGAPLAGVGRPLPGVAVAIERKGQYPELGPDVGEVTVRSTAMMQGYLPGLDQAAVPIGAFPTGDLGTILADGSIRLLGRIRDIINLGGMKVDPAEVEAVLMAYPGVADAAAYPGLRANGTEFVQAAVAGNGIDPAALRAHCLAELDTYKVPAMIHVVGQLPRTPAGKCIKIACPGYPADLLRARGEG